MTRPAPYPPDTKAKGWRFELDLEQVRQSDTWALAGAATRPWLLMLWAVAWEQVPCGSLPSDDALIAARMGMEIKAFTKVRAILLRGWWQADDGRLYQDTIVTRVMAMLDKRTKDAQRTANSRAKRSASQACHPDVTCDTGVSDARVTGEFDTKHQAPSTKHQDIAFKASESISTGDELDAAKAARARAHLFTSAVRTAGHSPARLSNDDPRLLRIIAMGATVDLVEAVAREASEKGKGPPWVYATVEGRLNDARASPVAAHSAGAATNRQEALEARNRAAVAAALAEGAQP